MTAGRVNYRLTRESRLATMARMGAASGNFDFLKVHDPQLVRLGALAERYFHDDPNTCLTKLRQFGEVLARLVAAKTGLYRDDDKQSDLLRRLRFERVLPQEVADLFHGLRLLGNSATHGTEQLGRLIVAKRGSRGVRAAAADVGISSATLSRVENGHMPDLETFAKICKWLGKDPREFLGFAREETAAPQAIVQFKKDRTVTRETAIALGELILAAQNAMRARAQMID